MDNVPGVLPFTIRQRIGAYLRLMADEGAGFLRGLYLLGSVALDDYQEGRSDIDFVALVSGPLDAADTGRLVRVHEATRRLQGPPFDGFYIEPAHLHRVPQAEHHASFSLDGTFHADAVCFETNPVTWLLLSRHGIAVRGPAPASLGIAADPSALRRFQIGNLRDYWTGWIANRAAALSRVSPDDSVNASILAWGVLGVARIAYTLATGGIVSKTGAGLWALEAYASDWHPTIRNALAARRGEIDTVPVHGMSCALDFMRQLIADILQSDGLSSDRT